ncbi:YicC/YloC family endoribonuclease [Sulfitobacter sabulilitoris]|uniref:YicC family protein n=1 Tax=Sulfitobacter sabulilitoris TaxID=2562655 RepID=A0A5S3PQ03_9RHOB|nr:YicC/YloC family endoribonuclease [Sulfitobacter sabulilitoris]TMM54615.1 YicC family protein [Sulfitobacter sabulilitoris]
MIRSMTGFASATGALPPHSWSWELRAVNGKGLDLRLRVPDWIDGLETGLRAQLVKVVARGNVTLSLRITREDTGGAQRVNAGQLNAVLNALAEIEAQAMDKGVSLAPSTASHIIALRGVLEQTTTQDDTTALAKVLHAEFASLVEAFNDMRQAEGAALQDVLAAQLTDIETLTTTAAAQAEDRRADMAQALRRNLARVMENAEGADEGRVAQELALIAVKADVTEEIDRLRSHVGAARDLLGQGGPVGRKLDFLMQEFNREANTLCSKAQSSALTGTGLALKAVIDQMREQVQNVE